MDNLTFYTIDADYIDYLVAFEPNVFHNAKSNQHNSRKYIGVVLKVNEQDYFAPLSSFKPKHRNMKDALDFIKIKDYAVLNLNCMIPAPKHVCHPVNFSKEQNAKYRTLLQAEYRVVKQLKEKIIKNASRLYYHKIENGNSTKLAARCNDFNKLEEAAKRY